MTQTIRLRLSELTTQILEGLLGSLPVILYSALLGLLAVLVAMLFARAARRILTQPSVQRLLERTEADLWLSRLGAQRSAADLLPRILFWLLLLLFVRSAADAVGLTAVSEAIGGLIGYMPVLFGAVLILLVGTVLARVAGNAVRSTAGAAGIDYARTLGRLVTVALLAITAVMAADQLGVDTAIIQVTLGAVLLALALGFALAFGLGAREVTRSILAGHYVRKTLEVGKSIQVGDIEGTLIGLTGTHLLIERAGKVVTVANTVMMESTIEQ